MRPSKSAARWWPPPCSPPVFATAVIISLILFLSVTEIEHVAVLVLSSVYVLLLLTRCSALESTKLPCSEYFLVELLGFSRQSDQLPVLFVTACCQYCKTLYLCCILISWFWNVEIVVHFNLAFSQHLNLAFSQYCQYLPGRLWEYGIFTSIYFVIENLMHAKNMFCGKPATCCCVRLLLPPSLLCVNRLLFLVAIFSRVV